MVGNHCSATQPSTRGPARRVLVVEDNADAGELLAAFLERAGHVPSVVNSAREALAIADALRPDIALIDIGLPDMNGFELVRSLRALPGLAGCRYVAVTGHKSQSAIARGISAGFEVYLTKPVNPADLLPLIAGDG
ncbi:MAG: response regulator [Pseudomonadota bacterium]